MHTLISTDKCANCLSHCGEYVKMLVSTSDITCYSLDEYGRTFSKSDIIAITPTTSIPDWLFIEPVIEIGDVTTAISLYDIYLYDAAAAIRYLYIGGWCN